MSNSPPLDLQSELVQTKRQLSELVDEIMFHEQKLTTKDRQNKKLMLEIQQQQSENEMLQQDLIALKTRIESLEIEKESWQRDCEKIQRERDLTSKKAADFELEAIQQRKRVSQMNVELSQYQEERKVLEEQIELTNQENETLRQQTQDLLDSFDHTRQELEKLKTAKTNSDTSQKLELNQIESMQQVIRDLEKQLDDVRVEPKNRLIEAKGVIDMQTREISRLKDTIFKFETQNKELHSELQALRIKANQANDQLNMSVQTNSITMDKDRRRIFELEEEREDALSRALELSQRLENSRMELRAKDQEIETLQKDNLHLETLFTQERRRSHHFESLAHSPRTPQSPVLREKQLKLMNIKLETLNEQNRLLSDENNYMSEQVKKLKKELDAAMEGKGQARDLNRQIDDAIHENIKLSEELTQERSNYNRLKAESDGISNRLKLVQREKEALSDQILQLEEEIRNTKGNVDERVRTLSKEKQELENELKMQQSSSGHSLERTKDLQMKLSRQLKQISTLDREQSELLQKIEDLKAELEIAVSKEKNLQKENEILKNQYNDVSEKLKSETQARLRIESDLKIAISEEKDRNNYTQIELEDLKSQLSNYGSLKSTYDNLKHNHTQLLQKFNKSEETLRDSLSNKDDLLSNVHRLKKQADKQANQLSEYQSKLQNEKRDNESLQNKLKHSSQKIQSLQEELNETRNEMKKTQSLFEQLSRENSDLSHKVMHKDNEISEFEHSKQNIDKTLQRFQNRIQQIEASFAEKEKSYIQQLSTQRTDFETILSKEQSKSTNVISKLKQDIEFLLHENRKIRQQSQGTSEQEILSLRNRIAEQSQSMIEIRKEISFTKAGLHQLQKALHTLLNTVAAQEEKIMKPLRSGNFTEKQRRMTSAYIQRVTQKMNQVIQQMDVKSKLLDARLQLRISAEFNRKMSGRIAEKEKRIAKDAELLKEVRDELEKIKRENSKLKEIQMAD